MKNDIDDLLSIMARLRDPRSGCPWDLQQDYASIVPHTLEEAYEVAHAIEQGTKEELRDELGDLLFQIIFYSQLAKEEQAFDFDDVVAAICQKMVRRHPHVFSDEKSTPYDEIASRWEEIKVQEKSSRSSRYLLDDIAHNMPALTRSLKLQKRAARHGFDWPDITPVFDKLQEEILEVREALELDGNQEKITEEVGDLLFSCVNLARHANIDPEQALRVANYKFQKRFNRVEELARQAEMPLTNCDLEQLEQYWQQAKQETS
ncbi:MAG: nucleoside triphosphate pyrophosphohydrolase [Gammaproteobacteria bacterium RBG_16_57_12]|nr:MAG: nucleoside triphosphate pyrophosphohydrolase [Gammaproteobacteria bacterium RBG_16_57_12]